MFFNTDDLQRILSRAVIGTQNTSSSVPRCMLACLYIFRPAPTLFYGVSRLFHQSAAVSVRLVGRLLGSLQPSHVEPEMEQKGAQKAKAGAKKKEKQALKKTELTFYSWTAHQRHEQPQFCLSEGFLRSRCRIHKEYSL